MSPAAPPASVPRDGDGWVPLEDAAVRVGASADAVRRWLPPRLRPGAEGDEPGALGYPESEVEWLRFARRLAADRVSWRRIRRALERLRASGGDAGGRALERVGSQIVARDEDGAWNAESGQGRLPLGAALEDSSAGSDATVADVVDLAAARRRRAAVADRERRLALHGSAEELYARAAEEGAAPEHAVELLRRVLELAPEHVEARLDLGALLHERGEVEEAERCYREAARIAPGSPTAWFDLGVALEDRGDRDGALDAYRRAHRLDPEDADACFNLSRLLESAGDRAGALAMLARYRRLLR